MHASTFYFSFKRLVQLSTRQQLCAHPMVANCWSETFHLGNSLCCRLQSMQRRQTLVTVIL